MANHIQLKVLLNQKHWIGKNVTDDIFLCPLESKQLNVGAGYKTLATNLLEFHLGHMPTRVNISLLDEGDAIASTFSSIRLSCTNDVLINLVIYSYNC